MSVKEISFLRKSGKLDEAYNKAKEELDCNPDDAWTQTAMFWVLRDFCLDYASKEENDAARDCLHKMEALLPTMLDENRIGKRSFSSLSQKILPEYCRISEAAKLSKENPVQAYLQVTEDINSYKTINASLHEDLGWIIFRYLKSKLDNIASVDGRTLLRNYLRLRNPRPSLLHSQFLNLAVSFSQRHSDFKIYNFFLLWNPLKLRDEDYKEQTYNDKKIPSLISRVYRQIVESNQEFVFAELCDIVDDADGIVIESLRESYFWKIFSLDKAGKKKELFDAFTAYNRMNSPAAPSHWNSEILKLAERFMTEDDSWRFVRFFKDWGYENLLPEDWRQKLGKDGNSYKSVGLKAAKKCYEFLKTQKKDAESTAWLSALYDSALANSPEDEWTLRERAIIYTWQGDYSNALMLYKKLLITLPDKYYLWEELANCIYDNVELRRCLLSKALTCERNEIYIGKIRLEMAEVLLHFGLYQEALFELNRYKNNHEKTSAKYFELIGQIKDGTIPNKSNKDLYLSDIPKAEDFAFSEVESYNVVLVGSFDDHGKIIHSFTDGCCIDFRVKEKRFPILKGEKTGSCFKVRCYRKELPLSTSGTSLSCGGKGVEYCYIPITINKTDLKPWSAFPLKYGYVQSRNEEKKILNIATEDSGMVFYHFEQTRENISKGDFVVFRAYFKFLKSKKVMSAANLQKCDKSIAIPHFKSGIIRISRIDEQNKQFYFYLEKKRLSGSISFKSTDIRPKIGDYLSVSYYMSNPPGGTQRVVVLSVDETT